MQDLIYVLGPVTSLLVWRAGSHGVIDLPSPSDREPDLNRARAHVKSIRSYSAIKALGDIPLDVIVGHGRYAHRSKSLDINVLSGQLPEGSFYSVDDGLYVCSPELIFALLARGSNKIHLAQVGCELCGTYAIKHNQTGMFCNCPSITNVGSIGKYLEKLGARHGCRNAQEVLAYLQDDSDSPKESQQYLMQTLPLSLGGYAIPKPKLNGKVSVSETAKQALGRGSITVDELWCDEDGNPILVGEYDSKAHHFFALDSQGEETVDVKKVIDNDVRREVIREGGTPVVTVRREDTQYFVQFDAKAMRIARILGVETIPSEGLMRTKRIDLFSKLFDAGQWGKEHETLREMAGYARNIRHPKRAKDYVPR